MKFGQQLENNIVPEWRKYYIQYTDLKKILLDISPEAPHPESSSSYEVSILLGGSFDRFFALLEKDLDKVTKFFQDRFSEFDQRVNFLREQAFLVESLENNTSSLRYLSLKPKKAQLRKAFETTYKGLLMLKNYGWLNLTGFVRLLKKHDRLALEPKSKEWGKKLSERSFSNPVEVDNILNTLEEIFARVFTKNNKATAKAQLRKRQHDHPDLDMFRLGLFTGISLPLLFILTFLMGQGTYTQTFLTVLPIFRLMFLIDVVSWFWGVNILVWHHARINHCYIFEFDSTKAANYRQVFKIAAILLTVQLVFLVLYLGSIGDTFIISPSIPPWVFPFCSCLFLLVFWLNPFDLFFQYSRATLARNLVHIAMSPFGLVKFKQFFLGDVLTSLVRTLEDFEYTVCYFVTLTLPADPNACTNANVYAVPIISALPLLWRLLQCLRRWWLTHDRLQLANALKYFVSMGVVVFGTPLGYNNHLFNFANPFQICWVFFMIVSTIYTYTWDVYIDWGLFRRNSKNFMLRDELVWRNKKWFYYYAIVSNLIFRFFWTLTISPIINEVNCFYDLFITALALVEILRRFTWSIIKIENEYLNNYEGFRAIKFVPLPFDRNHITPEMNVNVNLNQSGNGNSGSEGFAGGAPSGFFQQIYQRFVQQQPVTSINTSSLTALDENSHHVD
eukprot:TRINITY_DN14811_c0_g1_i1.p1 TRINITY_DN14811_c0_g1~~TRINITY_DN14811_c0_g1_i1.p1  ORF type:complete len:674 (+),score=115.64 TRINITY_DN14811_c0_g1_i1:40-2061(+)